MSQTVDDATITHSTNEESDGYVVGYMCTTNWEYELGAACGGNRIYPSIEDLKENSKCWKQCGITEVKTKFSKMIAKGFEYSD